MTILTLTNNEKAFLKLTLNYDDAEAQEGDNYSNAGMQEATTLMGSKHAGAGLIGSLTAKGVGSMDDEGDDLFFIKDAMVRPVFTALEA